VTPERREELRWKEEGAERRGKRKMIATNGGPIALKGAVLSSGEGEKNWSRSTRRKVKNDGSEEKEGVDPPAKKVTEERERRFSFFSGKG